MTSGNKIDTSGITSEALRMAASCLGLTLIYVLPDMVKPFTGTFHYKDLLFVSINLLVRCGVYGSFTASARGESGRCAGLFVRSTVKFLPRFIGLMLAVLAIPTIVFVLADLMYLRYTSLEQPIMGALLFPVVVFLIISMGIMFNKDSGVFSAVRETFGYISRLWPVFVIIGAGVIISEGHSMFVDTVSKEFNALSSLHNLITDFLDLFGFLYVSAYLWRESAEKSSPEQVTVSVIPEQAS